MAEFLPAGDVILDGRPLRGRTVQREDGSFESFDLREAKEGTQLTILTNEGAVELVRLEHEKGASALGAWSHKLGGAAFRLQLLESNSAGGTAFLSPSVVLRIGLELGVVYKSEDPKEQVIKNLGKIGNIAYRASAQDAQKSEILTGA